MENLLKDLRFGARMLFKTPAFTIVAVLTLALGIGANSAMFTAVNSILLKKLPVKDPDGLLIVGDPSRANSFSNGTPRADMMPYPVFKALREKNDVFESVFASSNGQRVKVEVDGKADGQSPRARLV